MSNDPEPLGDYLRAAREKAGLSIRELERLTGIGSSYLAKLETGKSVNPSAEVLQTIADVLEADASVLLSYIGVKPASVLPPAQVYFRNKLGLSEQEAAEAAALIEARYGKKNRTVDKEGGET